MTARDAASTRWIVVGLLALGLAIAYTDRVNLSVAIGDIAGTFGMDASQQGIALSAFFLPYALLQIPAGWLVDRYGIRTPYILALLLWSAAATLSAFAGSFLTLCLLRMLLGAGEAIVVPASMRYVREHFDEADRGLAVGLVMTGTKFGPAIAFPVAALLMGSFGWKGMFILTGLLPLPWLLGFMQSVKKNDPAATARPRLLAADSTDVPVRTLMASPAVWGTILGTFSYMYFIYFYVTWMPTYFRQRYGLSVEATGWYTGVSFAGMAVTALIGGKAADMLIARGWDPIAVRKGFTVTGLCLAVTQTLSLVTGSTSLMLFFSAFGLCALGLTTANNWALPLTLVPRGVVGTMVGIQNTAASLAGVAAPAITGWLISATGSLDAPIKAIGLWLGLGVASYLVLVRRRFAPKPVT